MVSVDERAPARLRTVAGEAGVVGAGTLLVFLVHVRAWRAGWREPWVLGGDATYYLMMSRSLQQGSGYLHNPRLGWPFGQSSYDLPQGFDNAHLLGLRVLGWITGNPVSAVNVFYVSTYFMVAFTAHLVLRALGCSRIASAVGAFVYAFAPYHFVRSESHLLLSGYELVPLGVLLALRVLDRDFSILRPGTSRIGWRSRRTWIVALIMVLLASTGVYYLAFTLLLLVVAGLVRACADRRLRPLATVIFALVVGIGAFFVNIAPSLWYLLRNGSNAAVAHRSAFETQIYGLRISQLFLPRPGHRIPVLARAADRTQGSFPQFASEPGQQLGLLGAIALAYLLLRLAVAAVDGRTREPDDRRALVERSGLLAVSCLVIGAIGGLSFLISAVGIREIRAYNRISIVIAFLTVIVVAVAVDVVGARLARNRESDRGGDRGRTRGRGIRLAVAAVAILVGYADQAGNDTLAYAAIHDRHVSDSSFFHVVATRLGPGAAVYNMPYEPFPEAPPRAVMGAYDQAIGYVYEPSLNWSYGFMRGRHADYPLALEQLPAVDALTSVAAIGFTGIVLDRFGYVPGEADAQEVAITALVGAPLEISDDGRYVFFDISHFASATRARLGAAGTKELADRTLRSGPPADQPLEGEPAVGGG